MSLLCASNVADLRFSKGFVFHSFNKTCTYNRTNEALLWLKNYMLLSWKNQANRDNYKFQCNLC